jgi:crooked neck
MLSLVPHKLFTFAKAWIMPARFEVRRLDLPAARKLLGTGIGMCPKEALFKGYIQLEMDVSSILFISSSALTNIAQLREFDHVRKLYEKYLEVCAVCCWHSAVSAANTTFLV